jgi:ferredoxin
VRIAVRVDASRCMGTQGCVATAADIFRLGPQGTSTVIRSNFTAEDLPALREAEEYCPFSAIQVELIEEGKDEGS